MGPHSRPIQVAASASLPSASASVHHAGACSSVTRCPPAAIAAEHDYQLEMYKPAAKRRWGYFALPILYGDRLVGKLDATADRKAGVLRVDAIHQDVPFDRTMTAAVDGEIKDLAHWLELDLTLPH
jgi:Winged helix DNA-binding domain